MRGLIIDYLMEHTTTPLLEMQEMSDGELFALYNETRDIATIALHDHISLLRPLKQNNA